VIRDLWFVACDTSCESRVKSLKEQTSSALSRPLIQSASANFRFPVLHEPRITIHESRFLTPQTPDDTAAAIPGEAGKA